jgi:hypothetical protein
VVNAGEGEGATEAAAEGDPAAAEGLLDGDGDAAGVQAAATMTAAIETAAIDVLGDLMGPPRSDCRRRHHADVK